MITNDVKRLGGAVNKVMKGVALSLRLYSAYGNYILLIRMAPSSQTRLY